MAGKGLDLTTPTIGLQNKGRRGIVEHVLIIQPRNLEAFEYFLSLPNNNKNNLIKTELVLASTLIFSKIISSSSGNSIFTHRHNEADGGEITYIV